MTFKEIKELIEIFDESNLTKLNLKENEFKIELDKTTPTQTANVAVTAPVSIPNPVTTTPSTQNTPTTPSATAVIDENADYISSPMVGTFYEAPSPESPAYVKVGDKVKAGQTVCIVEAMKIMNEITADYDCEILEILVDDGQAVEFDTKLFKVKRV